MSLLDQNLLSRFRNHVAESTSVDIAVAWATPCQAIEVLREHATSTAIRIVVGTSDNITSPSTLRRLHEFAELRIAASPPDGIFHPKYYCFKRPETATCWVGSVNLTNRGFGSNAELVAQSVVQANKDRDWFERLWVSLDRDPLPAILEYEQRYVPRRRSVSVRGTGLKSTLRRLSDVTTWDQFVAGLRARENLCHDGPYEWDILGRTHSYLHTIRVGRDVVRREDWTKFTQREWHILCPHGGSPENEGVWALLGSLRGSPVYLLNPSRISEVESVTTEIGDLISQVLNVDTITTDDARQVMLEISNKRPPGRRRIGPAAATRWLTLARPDRFITVNGAARELLKQYSGLPASTLTKRYDELLAWLWEQPWFNDGDGRRRTDPFEEDIWSCRAALVDAFVYNELNT